MQAETAIYAMDYAKWLALANVEQSGYIEQALTFVEDNEPDEFRLRFNLVSHETTLEQESQP
ncbi:hypothetical protein [Rheinheimera sp. MMS21-TC3]|uniref:hypothetical protein n=1 Tax=Rheinheimera sp. MMS21-TC3 TaxID=3072790 RepID=UPI0028C3CF0B|nr:hypothetical protein [Rheinheimera sp. MMS21-TC3]WNO62193.1 hypothetical protein RDV63_14910 [Rheinheimera sp. MMS21-TC3]